MTNHTDTDTISRLVEAGEAALAKSEFGAVLTMGEDIVKADPNNLDGWRLRAAGNLGKEDYDKSLDAADRCVGLDKDDALSHYFRAAALLGLGRLAEAEAAAHRSIDIMPTGACGLLLADAVLAQGDHERALGVLDVARGMEDVDMDQLQQVELAATHDGVMEEEWTKVEVDGQQQFVPTSASGVRNLRRALDRADQTTISNPALQAALSGSREAIEIQTKRVFGGRPYLVFVALFAGAAFIWQVVEAGQPAFAVLAALWFIIPAFVYLHAARCYQFEANAHWLEKSALARLEASVSRAAVAADRLHWVAGTTIRKLFLSFYLGPQLMFMPLTVAWHYRRQARVRKELEAEA